MFQPQDPKKKKLKHKRRNAVTLNRQQQQQLTNMIETETDSTDEPEREKKSKARPKPVNLEDLGNLQSMLAEREAGQQQKIAAVSDSADEPEKEKKSKTRPGPVNLEDLGSLQSMLEQQTESKQKKGKKPRHFGLPSQQDLNELDQMLAGQEAQTQDIPQRKRAGAVSAHSPKEQDVQWIVLPFEEGRNTLQASAEAYVKQRKQDPHAPRYIIVTHDPSTQYLSGVRPNHKVLLFAHGASGDSTNLYSGSDNLDGSKEKMTGAQLATQMLDAGLNPDGVKIKLTTCYGGGTNNVMLDEAKQMDTLARTFATEVGNQSLERGRGLPTYVDGFVGKVSTNTGPISDKNSRRLTMGVQLTQDEQFGVLPVTLSDGEPSEAAKQESKRIAHKRAKHNRVRYNLQQNGDSSAVNVSLNEQDYQRAEQARLDAEAHRTLQEIGGVKEGKWKKLKRNLGINHQ